MPDSDIKLETVNHMLAGPDATSICLTFGFCELSRLANILNKFQAEPDEATLDPRSCCLFTHSSKKTRQFYSHPDSDNPALSVGLGIYASFETCSVCVYGWIHA
ncbi:hypothetical protein PILCRDRAFT_14887 [Piloderma croceum F 1598]|uniref:Uncharacterized protein n=1 Tax=Piloderma croceum (strain F 1598) TaxID=765440 RepID=A0A0C3AJ71_PILCF|nr:hypothetical protein PILCRDRAFT_14887 [Piloderma croceum F 1598]